MGLVFITLLLDVNHVKLTESQSRVFEDKY